MTDRFDEFGERCAALYCGVEHPLTPGLTKHIAAQAREAFGGGGLWLYWPDSRPAIDCATFWCEVLDEDGDAEWSGPAEWYLDADGVGHWWAGGPGGGGHFTPSRFWSATVKEPAADSEGVGDGE